MSIDRRTLDNLGVNSVTNFVETRILCGWQGYDAKNDNAFDGMIIMKKGSKILKETGGIIFTQIKCGTTSGYKVVRIKDPDNIGLNVGREYIESHRERWNIVPSPAILIFVDADGYDVNQPNKYEPVMYWVDLKKEESYCNDNKQLILVPRKNKLTLKSKGDFHKLCGPKVNDFKLTKLYFKSENSLKVNINHSLKKEALLFYKFWKNSAPIHPKLGNILINRRGWRHITRPDRATHRIIASWLLLPVAKKILETVVEYQILKRAKINVSNDVVVREDYLGLNAKVYFNYRDTSLVQVILFRKTIISKKGGISEKIWFHSVFEKRRGKEI